MKKPVFPFVLRKTGANPGPPHCPPSSPCVRTGHTRYAILSERGVCANAGHGRAWLTTLAAPLAEGIFIITIITRPTYPQRLLAEERPAVANPPRCLYATCQQPGEELVQLRGLALRARHKER